MLYITDIKNTWWLLLIAVIFWFQKKRGTALKAFLGVIIVVTVSDQFNSKIIKNWVQRPRPSMGLEPDQVRLITYKHSGYSFMSSHAFNAFSAAAFVSLVEPATALLAFLIATLVALSRVYIGVHYPSDIFAGSVCGIMWGYIFWKIWMRKR